MTTIADLIDQLEDAVESMCDERRDGDDGCGGCPIGQLDDHCPKTWQANGYPSQDLSKYKSEDDT